MVIRVCRGVAYVSLGLPCGTSPNECLLETHWATKEALVLDLGTSV